MKSIKSKPNYVTAHWILCFIISVSAIFLYVAHWSFGLSVDSPFEQRGNPFKLGTAAAIISDTNHFSPNKSIATLRAAMHVQYVLSHYVRRGANGKWHKCSWQKHKQDGTHISLNTDFWTLWSSPTCSRGASHRVTLNTHTIAAICQLVKQQHVRQLCVIETWSLFKKSVTQFSSYCFIMLMFEEN